MSGQKFQIDPSLWQEWQAKIATANRHNIFCHCCHCNAEWVDSSLTAACPSCSRESLNQ